MIDVLEIRCWNSPLPDLKYEYGKRYKYTDRLRNKIINNIINLNYNIMLQTIKPSLGESYMIIWVDKYRFGQK